MNLSRRQFFAALAAGGTVVAGELWVPGRKLISIPKVHRIGGMIVIDDPWRMPPHHPNCRCTIVADELQKMLCGAMKELIERQFETVFSNIINKTLVGGGPLRNYALPNRNGGTVVVAGLR